GCTHLDSVCRRVLFRPPRAGGVVAGCGGLRSYCGLVRLGPHANGATEAEGAEVTNSRAKGNAEDTARASDAEGRPPGALKTSSPKDGPADDAERTVEMPAAATGSGETAAAPATRTNAERNPTAGPGRAATAGPEGNPTAGPGRAATAGPEANATAGPERTETASPEQASTSSASPEPA